MRDITVKDALYALEYMRDAMLRIPPPSPGGKPRWVMKATGAKVPEAVANEVRASGMVTSIPERDGRELVVWKSAA